jgi:hypothetical protein
MQTENHLKTSFRKTIRTFINLLPIIIGMILVTSLVITMFQEQISSGLFGNGEILDTSPGASIGSSPGGKNIMLDLK